MSRLEDSLIPDPNTTYDESHTVIATLSNTTDTNQFCNTYNHNNKYNGLKLGNIINIYYDGSYTRWYIAGFDVEYNKVASDGKSYDNGYGIALIPEINIGESQWNTTDTVSGGYLNSYINKTTLVNVANNLKTVLGNHLVNRKVLLSSSVSGNNANNYTWTTAYCTLMSIGQMTGTFAQNRNKYDDGEANYKLPLFDYMEYKTGSDFWLRGIYYSDRACTANGSGGISASFARYTNSVRPLIYIR